MSPYPQRRRADRAACGVRLDVDRRTAHAFYTALGFDAPGEPAADGVPEPLQIAVNPGLRLMFIPTGGFGWVTGDHQVAAPGHSECLLSLSCTTRGQVDEYVDRAERAGARIVSAERVTSGGIGGLFRKAHVEATVEVPDASDPPVARVAIAAGPVQRIGIAALLARPPADGGPPEIEVPLTIEERGLSVARIPATRLPAIEWPEPRVP